MDFTKNAIDDNAVLGWLKGQTPVMRTFFYPFSWGGVNESITAELGPWCVDFEFLVPKMFLAFPSRFHLVDLCSWMYHSHPLKHHTLVPNLDVMFDVTVISFRAKGVRATELRAWLIEVFIPLIWPDLLREAMRIISEVNAGLTSAQSPAKLVASWSGYLCHDPKSLSFYKATSE